MKKDEALRYAVEKKIKKHKKQFIPMEPSSTKGGLAYFMISFPR